MSKKKKEKAPKAPAFQPSEIRVGGRVVGRTYLDGGVVRTEYFEDPAETQRKQIAQQKINQILPTLGMVGPELQQQFRNTRQNYIDSQTSLFNTEYDKSLRSLREDIGARFGTLKATPYFDRLEDLEKNVKSPALQEIGRSADLLTYDLENQEQGRKLRDLSALGYTLNQDQSNFLNTLQAPLSTSQLYNQFNQNAYMQRLQQFNSDLARQQSATNSFLSFLGR